MTAFASIGGKTFHKVKVNEFAHGNHKLKKLDFIAPNIIAWQMFKLTLGLGLQEVNEVFIQKINEIF